MKSNFTTVYFLADFLKWLKLLKTDNSSLTYSSASLNKLWYFSIEGYNIWHLLDPLYIHSYNMILLKSKDVYMREKLKRIICLQVFLPSSPDSLVTRWLGTDNMGFTTWGWAMLPSRMMPSTNARWDLLDYTRLSGPTLVSTLFVSLSFFIFSFFFFLGTNDCNMF